MAPGAADRGRQRRRLQLVPHRPLGRFAVAEDRDLVAIVVFGIVALVASTLAEVARARTEEAERGREQADRALAELAALSRERDRMQAEAVEAEALRRSDELKTSLLRSVSHDLRTPSPR